MVVVGQLSLLLPVRVCAYCAAELTNKHGGPPISTKKYCNNRCACAGKSGRIKVTSRNCRYCNTPFAVNGAADGNRRHCSKSCAKNSTQKVARQFNEANPGAMRGYNQTRISKTPDAWRTKSRDTRNRILSLLGGACAVCGADNQWWLHVDYIPTTRGLRFRHSRGIKFVREHLTDFRILCANHHYELTLTGQIEGSDITQQGTRQTD